MNTTEGAVFRNTSNGIDSIVKKTGKATVMEARENCAFNKEDPETRLNMVAYVFYCNKGREEDGLIGVLKERRKNKRRVTHKSIMKWGKLAAGSNVDPNNIYYLKLDL